MRENDTDYEYHLKLPSLLPLPRSPLLPPPTLLLFRAAVSVCQVHMEAPESLLSQKFHNPRDYEIQSARKMSAWIGNGMVPS